MNHRTLRLFLSSTFRDFGEERDLLVRQLFPALRARLKDRFVELVDVDLRWGITVEQAERGEVLPICLAEIDRARPYFIGMLGERYGWIPPPEGFAPDLIERQPWLKKHQGGKSVTELEILHGVLNNRRMKGRAFFYFRSATYAKQMGGDYVPSSTEDRQRQVDLKRRIKASGYPVTAYRDPQALAKRLERDLWKLLDAEFPASSVPDAFEREVMRHEAYATPRRRLYLGGERYQAQVAAALESNEQRIVIEGASGGGKSALLANFFEGYRKRYPRRPVHEHYLGASADAGDPFALVRRLAEFIKRQTHSREEIESDPQKLMDSLPLWLATASAWARKRKTRFVFVLDALNSLTDQQDLRWWPDFLPQGVHVVVSCLPGPVLRALKAKAEGLEGQAPRWKAITVKPLTKTERKRLLTTYLVRFNKTLPKSLTTQVMAHPLSGNPLFIRTLAEELRLFGVHEELTKRLKHYLNSQTIDDLFEKVIERVEGDCGKRAVKNTLTAIWASRAGLTEKEVLAVADLKSAEWAPIRIALEESLLEGDGKLRFAHEYMQVAIKDRYLHSNSLQQQAHRFLGLWFREQPLDARRSEEETWQFVKAKAWRYVRHSIIDRGSFQALMLHRGKRELNDFWRDVEKHTRYRSERAYELAWLSWKRARNRDQMLDALVLLLEFMRYRYSTNRFLESVAIQALTLARRQHGLSSAKYEEALAEQALLMRARGDFAKSEELLLGAIEIQRKLYGSQSPKVAERLNDLGNIYQDQGRWRPALETYKQAYDLTLRLFGEGNATLALSLNNIGTAECNLGNFRAAIGCLEQALSIIGKTYGANHFISVSVLNNLAIAFAEVGEFGPAARCAERSLQVAREAFGKMHPGVAGTQETFATILQDQGRLQEAEVQMRESVRVTEHCLGSSHSLMGVRVNNLARILHEGGRLAEAEIAYRRAHQILSNSLGKDHPSTAMCLTNIAEILRRRGKIGASEAVSNEAIGSLKRSLGPTHPAIAIAQNNFGVALLSSARYANAELQLFSALSVMVAARGSDHPAVASCVQNIRKLGNAYIESDPLGEALPFISRAMERAALMLPPDSVNRCWIDALLGELHIRRGLLIEAKSWFGGLLARVVAGPGATELREFLQQFGVGVVHDW